MSTQTETSDRQMVDFIRQNRAVTISALIAEMGVTATAVRQRLQRLITDGLIERIYRTQRPGRPNHRYSLTEKGDRTAGNNFADMASVLWDEIKSVEDPDDSTRPVEANRRAVGGAVSE